MLHGADITVYIIGAVKPAGTRVLPSGTRDPSPRSTDMTDPSIPIRIRKIGHVGLYCRDLAKMVDFYTRVLGFKVSDVNEKGMTFLRFGGDHHSFVLAKMADDEQKKGAGATLLQQIAMEVASLDALKRIRKYLLSQGVNVRGKIKHEGPGNDYTFDFDDPEGNRLQFFSDMDRIGWDGKSRPKGEWKRFEVEDLP
jgi:catechol-2,3-dioxygenase